MMHVVKKWKVTYHAGPEWTTTVFHVSDDHIENVLRQLSNLDFGLDVKSITIEEAVRPQPTVTVETYTMPAEVEGRRP